MACTVVSELAISVAYEPSALVGYARGNVTETVLVASIDAFPPWVQGADVADQPRQGGSILLNFI